MQTVLITGVTDGIGHALAIQYAAGGARVLGVGRRAFPASLAHSMRREDYCTVELGDAEAATTVRNFLQVRSVDFLDVLVHNAAVGWYGSAAQQSPASIDELLAVNLVAPIALTHALLPHVRAARGVIAFVSSVHSALATPEFAVYTATKAALDGFARNLRLEERGAVAVVVLWPGPTRTGMHAKSGIPADQIKAERYAAPEQVAGQVIAAVRRRRSRALGLGNRALRWVATRFEPLVDALLGISARRTSRQTGQENLVLRHAVVTGAAEGIGRAVVEVLGTHGYAITGIDVNAARAAQTQQELASRGLNLKFLHADLSQSADLDRLAEILAAGPAIDVLVHNAGINCVGAFAHSDLAAQQAVLDVNLRAPLRLTAALLGANKVAPGGTLIFVSSLSRFVSYPGAAVYGASKDGLASYARSLAVALAPQGIHVLVVYPGPTRTAHARRYSPDNRREARRMPPEVLAAAIYRALAGRRRTLVPGFGNRVFAWAGRWLPAPVEWIMKRTLFDKL